MMSEVVAKLLTAGELNGEQVERIGERVRDFIKAAKEDLELFEQAKEKLAAGGLWGPVAKNLAGGAALTAGSALGLGGYNVIAGKLQEIRDDKAKAMHYKNMLDASPDLAEGGADATIMQRHFNTLFRFNPEYAKDPMVAAAYVDQSMESAKPSIGILNELVRARGEHVRSQQGAKAIPQPAQQFVGSVMGIHDKATAMNQMLKSEMERARKDRGGEGTGGHM
jgi:hypothetical protein